MGNYFTKAINLLGGNGGVARVFGVRPQAISQMDLCPIMRARQLEAAVNKRVTRYQLRPDVFGDGTDV